jgi:nucleobase:cation symporter-1, NCS1 family
MLIRPAMFNALQNIRRGGYIAAIVGFAICPWNFLSSSTNFTSYLSAYSVFLSSIAGVMVSGSDSVFAPLLRQPYF